jgi:hypothetical protein
MSSFFAHPALFSALAVAADDDPDLRGGTHIRLLPSPVIGLPLAPFLISPLEPRADTLQIHWVDRRGNQSAANLDAAGGELRGWVLTVPPDDGRLIGAEVMPGSASQRLSAALLDRIGDRIIVQRSEPRFTLGAPFVSRFRLEGKGPIEMIRGYDVTPIIVAERLVEFQRTDEHILALPVEELPWYTGGRGPDPGFRRVRNGAPRRFSPVDRPDGPFDPLPSIAELARVGAMTPDIDSALDFVLGHRSQPPWGAQLTHDWPSETTPGLPRRPPQTGNVRSRDALVLQALDPGIGRYLGLMTRLDSPPPGSNPTVWAAAGVFAVDRGQSLTGERPSRFRIGDILPAPDDLETRLLVLFTNVFPRLGEVIGEVTQQGLEARVLVTVALAAPPPDLLTAPVLRLREPFWIRENDQPSFRYRQEFLFARAPLSALLAMARFEGGNWKSRHRTFQLPSGNDPASRAAPLLLGRNKQRLGVATDESVPAEGAPWRYRFRYGDLFGRYGEPGEIDSLAPSRPRPPRPSPQTFITANDRAAHDGPSPFGSLEVRVFVPTLVDLAAGSRSIATIHFDLSGDARDVNVVPGTVSSVFFSLPSLMPMETRQLVLKVSFIDETGAASEAEHIALDIADPRPPKIIPTGVGILWTSRPGPSAEVEVRLAWPAPPDARFRAYLADAQGLDIPVVEGPALRQRTRAEIAADGANRAQSGTFDMRSRFRLLSEPPLVAGPDGRVILDERIPRALSTVQFLRIVPMSGRNVEADFAKSGLVPIAVPSDRRPPSPRVAAVVNAETGVAHITIDAVGLDLVELRAAEPGLFNDPPDPASRPPEFRLRRAIAPVPEPVYAREIARGAMQLTTGPEGPSFTANFDDAPPGGLLPFVQVSYWAEVRLPAERRVPQGFTEVPPSGGIVPTEAHQATNAPRAFSLPSVPIVAMRVPIELATLTLDQVTATTRADTIDPTKFVVELKVENGPKLSPHAIGPYKLKLWIQPAGKHLEPVADQPALVSGNLTWTSPPQDPANGSPPVVVHVAILDPIGRTGHILAIPAEEV